MGAIVVKVSTKYQLLYYKIFFLMIGGYQGTKESYNDPNNVFFYVH
jgi:hypothetical protein